MIDDTVGRITHCINLLDVSKAAEGFNAMIDNAEGRIAEGSSKMVEFKGSLQRGK